MREQKQKWLGDLKQSQDNKFRKLEIEYSKPREWIQSFISNVLVYFSAAAFWEFEILLAHVLALYEVFL